MPNAILLQGHRLRKSLAVKLICSSTLKVYGDLLHEHLLLRGMLARGRERVT